MVQTHTGMPCVWVAPSLYPTPDPNTKPGGPPQSSHATLHETAHATALGPPHGVWASHLTVAINVTIPLTRAISADSDKVQNIRTDFSTLTLTLTVTFAASLTGGHTYLHWVGLRDVGERGFGGEVGLADVLIVLGDPSVVVMISWQGSLCAENCSWGAQRMK